MSGHDTAPCGWCDGLYHPRATGGRPQRFCGEQCRRAFEAALRAWAQDEFAAGRVTITLLRQRARCADAQVDAAGYRDAPEAGAR